MSLWFYLDSIMNNHLKWDNLLWLIKKKRHQNPCRTVSDLPSLPLPLLFCHYKQQNQSPNPSENISTFISLNWTAKIQNKDCISSHIRRKNFRPLMYCYYISVCQRWREHGNIYYTINHLETKSKILGISHCSPCCKTKQWFSVQLL